MDNIHIDAFVNQFMEKLFSPLNRLDKNKDWRSKALQENKLVSGLSPFPTAVGCH